MFIALHMKEHFVVNFLYLKWLISTMISNVINVICVSAYLDSVN
jgi:hypothetical protein